MNNQLKPIKSFWDKPQGTTGMIGVGLLVFGAGYLLLKNAEWIANAFSNLTSAVFMGIGLFAIFWLLSDKKFRTLIWYFYKVGMEKLTSLFIEINPIGIMKAYVSSLKDKRNDMNNQLLKLKREKGKLSDKIDRSKKEIATLMKKASKAKAQADPRLKALMTANARKASRRKSTAIELTELLNKMNSLYTKMEQMYFYSGIMVDDVEDQIENIEFRRNAIHASHSVMKSAQSIIAGNSSEAELFDRALEHVADDLGAKVGEMERFMDISQNFINGVDLDNQVFEEEGLLMLEEWEAGNDLDFLNNGSTDYLEVIRTQMNNDGQPEPIILERQIESTPPKQISQSSGEKNFFN